MRRLWMIALAAVMVAACGEQSGVTTTQTTAAEPGEVVLTFEFENGSGGWASELSDYGDQTRPEEVLSETGVRPPGIDEGEGFFHLAAENRSDDLFQYMLRRVGMPEGLAPGQEYTVSFDVTFASDAPSGCVGIGGAPGESVWMKVGATPEQPVPVDEDGETRLTIDKGNQAQGGADAEVAGIIANGIPCEEALGQDPAPYAMVELSHTLDGTVAPGPDGTLWLLVGVDSGFEGRTSIFYDTVTVRLMP